MSQFDDENRFDISIDDYIDNYISKSTTGEYVLFAYIDDSDKVYVVDKGSLPFCIERMRDSFDLLSEEARSRNSGGMSIVPIEEFAEMVGDE